MTLTGGSKSKKQCPKLFYRFKASPSNGLELLLTDLITLWHCFQSNPDIVTTAGDQHVSIDPSESEEQMNVLLDKIASSLREGTNKLAKQAANSSEERVLLLKTGINLPKPLRPLEWTFALLPQSASELAAQILRPTLHELSKLQSKLESLLSIVKEKDHVIERLLDRVAEKGVDLSLIFPTLTGTARRGEGVKIEDAKKNIPGLRPFDRRTWEKGVVPDEKVDIDCTGVTELVKGCEKCFVHSKEEHNGWLECLPGAESLEMASSKSFLGRSQSQSQRQPGVGDDTESENEFETQATPPGVKTKSVGSDEDTSENLQPVAKKAKTGKINTLGQRKQLSKPRPSRKQDGSSSSPIPPVRTSPPPPPHRKSSPVSATDTESDTHEVASPPQKKPRLRGLQKKQSTPTTAKSPEPGTSPSRLTTAASNANASMPSRRLGRIGKTGRKATASPVPEETKDQPGLGSQTATPRKLGRLGARRKDGGTQSSATQDTPREERLDAKEDPNAVSNDGGGGGGDDSDATASPPRSPSPSPSKPTHQRNEDARKAEAEDASSKDSSPPPDQDRVRAPEPKHVPEPEPEPETENQKAARRREELKRRIQTPGAKKKRRF